MSIGFVGKVHICPDDVDMSNANDSLAHLSG